MAWTTKILEVTRPGLDRLTIRFMLQKDGVDHVGLETTFLPSELLNKTAEEKEAYIAERLVVKASSYIEADGAFLGIESTIKEEYEVE